MSPARGVSSRGAALLIVLAALVLVVAVAAPAVRLRALVIHERRNAAASLLLDDLLREAERPIRHWLHEHSDRVALPPDAESPSLIITDDVADHGEIGRISIRLTAYDQCGMLPWGCTDRAMSLTVPDDMRSPPVSRMPGLDLVATGHRLVFPDPHSGQAVAVGELLATHNPPPTGSGGRSAINVNTAPRNLLAAALRSSGRGAIEAILDARSAGRPFSSFARAGVQEEAAGPRIVGASNCWSFRIDLRVGMVARSWWSVYALRGSEWVRVQRLAITE